MKNVDGLLQKGMTALQGGRLRDAERCFRQAVELAPRHFGALNLLTVALTGLERFEEAEAFAARALKIDATNDATHYNYGTVLKHNAKLEPAIAAFDARAGMTQTLLDPQGAWGLYETTARDQIRLLQHLVAPNRVLGTAERSYELALMHAVDPAQGLTVVQALSLAWGPTQNAAAGKALLIREQKGGRTLITLNLRRMIHGQDPDQPIYDRDILLVPDSMAKNMWNRALESAIQSAVGVSIYAGLVYSQRF